MKYTNKQLLEYYKKKKKIDEIVKKHLQKKKKLILYGARAYNVHFPSFLDTKTTDWDVYSKTPKKSAQRVEKKLDKKFGGNYFYVQKAKYPQTHKVKSYVTEKTVTDMTKPQEKVPHVTKQNMSVVKLSYAKKRIQQILKDKTQEFRHAKDRETLRRMKAYEQWKKSKPKSKPKFKGLKW